MALCSHAVFLTGGIGGRAGLLLTPSLPAGGGHPLRASPPPFAPPTPGGARGRGRRPLGRGPHSLFPPAAQKKKRAAPYTNPSVLAAGRPRARPVFSSEPMEKPRRPKIVLRKPPAATTARAIVSQMP